MEIDVCAARQKSPTTTRNWQTWNVDKTPENSTKATSSVTVHKTVNKQVSQFSTVQGIPNQTTEFWMVWKSALLQNEQRDVKLDLRAIHTDQFSGTISRCQSTCTSKLACVSCHWYQNFTYASHCRQLTPETGTGYWYQKTGQCVWPINLHYQGRPEIRKEWDIIGNPVVNSNSWQKKQYTEVF